MLDAHHSNMGVDTQKSEFILHQTKTTIPARHEGTEMSYTSIADAMKPGPQKSKKSCKKFTGGMRIESS